MWRSFGVSCCFVRLFRHSSTQCHSDSGLGFSYGGTFEVSSRVYTRVLLQHTRYRYLCTLFCHDISRYTYRSYPRSYIWGITCLEGSASWLPRLWLSSDCVQRRASVSFLWDTFFHIGWEAKHPMLGLCKRSEIP